MEKASEILLQVIHYWDVCRIIKLFELESTFKDHLVLLPCNEQGYLQLDHGVRAPSSLTLTVSQDKASTTNLSNLCPSFNILIVKELLISNLNLSTFTLQPFSLVLSQQALLKSLFPLLDSDHFTQGNCIA